MKTTIAHVGVDLNAPAAFAQLGGIAVYLLGLVAFRYRHVHTVNRHRLAFAVVLLPLVPIATLLPPLVAVAAVDAALWAMIGYETRNYGEGRHRVRRPQRLAAEGEPEAVA
jgi:hypothetical protein